MKRLLIWIQNQVQFKFKVCLSYKPIIQNKTDNQINEAIFKFAEQKTLLVITHRLEHIQRFDRIFVMDGGTIIEQGHFHELIQKKDGFFRQFIEDIRGDLL